MFQVRIYLLMLSKYPRKSKGYFGYRLETIDKQGRVHEKTVYDEEEDITANQLALVAMYRAFEGEPVANGDLWRKLEKVTEQHVVRFNTEYQWPARGRMTRELMERKERHVG